MTDGSSTQIAFVSVQNAGRSQMAYAFAERELEQRGLQASIEIVTGGTQPARCVHPVVVDAMRDLGIDVADRRPRTLTEAELRRSDIVITMGCSVSEVCPRPLDGEHRDWALSDPAERSVEEVVSIRDEIERRVKSLIDEMQESE